ncbi:MAG: choice-of-anchor I family protein [bacterium]|nr:choice-of-anchor I family protein [bacterium]
MMLGQAAWAQPPTAEGSVSLLPLGTYHGGGPGRAEIVAFDPSTDHMFITNGDQNTLEVVSIADPAAPVLVTSVDMSPYGDGINSVAVGDGIVAVAVEVDPSFDPDTAMAIAANGHVVFLDTGGAFLSRAPVGNLPDMVAFTPDKQKAVVAGEGEPICASDELGGGEEQDASLAVDPLGTVSIIDVSDGATSATVTTLDFSSFDKNALLAKGVRVFWPGSTAAQDLEPEYAAISDDGARAYVVLQEANALAVVDLVAGTIADVVSLGYKDYSNVLIDPSDRDGAISLSTWNVKGMYMPDAIDAFTVGGSTYLITANEGDSRDYDCWSEEERMDDLDYTNAVIGDDLVAAAADSALLGRLKTTSAFPVSTPISQLYAYGGRSFSIWDASGQLVWDSGSQFSEIVARDYPDYFNAQADDEADADGDGTVTPAEMVASMADGFEARSDDKGVEPEAVVVGEVNGRAYAFIGLERLGGIMIYDVHDPTAPVFVGYENLPLRTLAEGKDLGGPGTVDVSPEGLAFVDATDSPTGNPLLLVASELSGTTTVFEIAPTSPDPGDANGATMGDNPGDANGMLAATGVDTRLTFLIGATALAAGWMLIAASRRAPSPRSGVDNL